MASSMPGPLRTLEARRHGERPGMEAIVIARSATGPVLEEFCNRSLHLVSSSTFKVSPKPYIKSQTPLSSELLLKLHGVESGDASIPLPMLPPHNLRPPPAPMLSIVPTTPSLSSASSVSPPSTSTSASPRPSTSRTISALAWPHLPPTLSTPSPSMIPDSEKEQIKALIVPLLLFFVEVIRHR